MKFSKRFERDKVPAWAPFYVSYKKVKDFISPFKYMKKGIFYWVTLFDFRISDLHLCNPYNQGTLDIHNFTRKDKEKLLYFVKLFEEMIVTDVEKVWFGTDLGNSKNYDLDCDVLCLKSK